MEARSDTNIYHISPSLKEIPTVNSLKRGETQILKSMRLKTLKQEEKYTCYM